MGQLEIDSQIDATDATKPCWHHENWVNRHNANISGLWPVTPWIVWALIQTFKCNKISNKLEPCKKKYRILAGLHQNSWLFCATTREIFRGYIPQVFIIREFFNIVHQNMMEVFLYFQGTFLLNQGESRQLSKAGITATTNMAFFKTCTSSLLMCWL